MKYNIRFAQYDSMNLICTFRTAPESEPFGCEKMTYTLLFRCDCPVGFHTSKQFKSTTHIK